MERVAAAEAERPDAWVGLSPLAKEIGVSAPSLAQIAHRLRRAGLLSARRGPSGGVGLPRPAERITVLEVVRAIDGTGVSSRCILGFENCTDDTPCPAHPVWSTVRPLLERELERKTLLDLVEAVKKKRKASRKRPKGAAKGGRE